MSRYISSKIKFQENSFISKPQRIYELGWFPMTQEHSVLEKVMSSKVTVDPKSFLMGQFRDRVDDMYIVIWYLLQRQRTGHE